MQTAVISSETETLIRKALLESCAPDPLGRLTVYAMAGIPGAGKSSFVRTALKNRYFPENAFILNPDLVLEMIPGYRQDCEEKGAQEAFAKWEMPSRALAYALTREAMERKLPIIKDMGMVRPENWKILMEMRAAGYKVLLHHIICDADEAVRRCALRERHFPAHRVYERARELDALMADFAGVADEIQRFENSDLDHPFVPVQPATPASTRKTA